MPEQRTLICIPQELAVQVIDGLLQTISLNSLHTAVFGYNLFLLTYHPLTCLLVKMGAVCSTLMGCYQSLKRCLPGAELSEHRPTKTVCSGFEASDLAFPGFAEMPKHAEDSAVQIDQDTYTKFLQILHEQRTIRELIQQKFARAVEEALDNDRMDRLCQHFDRAMALPPSLLTEDDLLSRHLDRAITMPSGPAMDLDELEDFATN